MMIIPPDDAPDAEDASAPELPMPSDSADDAGHVPVLAETLLTLLEPAAGQVMLDCTVGRGGHALLFAPRLSPGGRLVALDADPVNADFVRARFQAASPRIAWSIHHANFIEAPAVLREALGVTGEPGVDLLLADLGFASSQMADPSRGFSFGRDGPLDMRLDPRLPTTAADLVARLPERELANLIYRLGEEPLSRRIARNIVETRRRQPILTTAELAALVRASYGGRARYSRMDPATRTFMALRIAVNQELEVLEELLGQLPLILRPGGRAAIISFHSLEDRIVKHAFRRLKQEGQGEILTRKPVEATEQERATNPRSRSAKLRVFRRAGG